MTRSRFTADRRPLLFVVMSVVLACPSSGRAVPTYEDHEPRLLVTAPSEVVVGETARWSVLYSATWGTEGPEVPSAGLERAIRLEVSTTDEEAELEDRLRITEDDMGRGLGSLVFRTPGLHRIRVDGEAGLAGISGPIRVLAGPPLERVFWGDLHAHLHGPGAGHAGELAPGEHASLLEEGLAFGRDVSLLDFCSFTPHLQTAGGLATHSWNSLLEVVEEVNDPGRFVVFPGFEWQGNEGDHCVIYPGPGELDAPADFERLAESVDARGGLLTAHTIFLPTRFEPRVALAGIEVTRDTRSAETLGFDGLRKGAVASFLGGSDTHGGTVGSTSLTGIRAPRLTRGAVLSAIREGRAWATNGSRIVIEFQIDTEGRLPVLRLSGTGTGPVDHVEFWRNGVLLGQLRPGADGETEAIAPITGSSIDDSALEFAFEWEDRELLHLECLDRSVAYHARVVQTTTNRWDPSRRDVAIASPVAVRLEARHFDAAHAQAGGRSGVGVGEALVAIRSAWDPFRSAPDRALRADPPDGAPAPAWGATPIDSLRSAVRRLTHLATRDTTLLPLASNLAPIPEIAAALVEIGALHKRAGRIGTPGFSSEAALRREARDVHRAAATAMKFGPSGSRDALSSAWFGSRLLEKIGTAPLREIANLTEETSRAAKVRIPANVASDSTGVSRLEIPIDPRILAALGPVTARTRRLRDEFVERWGYTSAPSREEELEPAFRVRVVAEGNRSSARLEGMAAGEAWEIPLAGEPRGWTATIDRRHVPAPGEPAPVLTFHSPVTVSTVFLEKPNGAPLRAPGRLRSVRTIRSAAAASVALEAEAGPVEVMLRSGPRVLWSGVLPVGPTALAFPGDAFAERDDLVASWGFAGWRRVSGTTITGHEAARPLGLGALPDGRAFVALESGVLLVDPATGRTDRVEWPVPGGHERGRELCVVPLGPDRVLVRGASGPGSGWARFLDPATGAWSPVPDGPETGTVAAHPDGGYAWLTGRTLHRRDVAGVDRPATEVDTPGRLLGFDPAGRVVVRIANGNAVRLDPSTGAAVDHLEGVALTVDETGAIVLLEGLTARHRELALGVRLARVLPDGTRLPAVPLAIKALPAQDPPLLLASTPDGALLALGGTTWWRRLPDHDWWGATVERWEGVWAGESTTGRNP